MDVTGLAGDEVVTVHLRVMMYYPGGNRGINVQSTDITTANDHGALSFPVPAEIFYFSLDIASGTTA